MMHRLVVSGEGGSREGVWWRGGVALVKGEVGIRGGGRPETDGF